MSDERAETLAASARILLVTAGVFLVLAGLASLYASEFGIDRQTGDLLGVLLLLVAAIDALIGLFLLRRSRSGG